MSSFSFDIFAGVSSEEPGTERPENELPQEIQDNLKSPGSAPRRQFIPRTPSSSKVQRGERGALVTKMYNALRQEVEQRLGSTGASPQYEVIERSSTQDTDLEGIDPDIRAILNSFGIFFFADIPSSIIITYGSLLARDGNVEEFQLARELDLKNSDLEDLNLKQDSLSSQKVLRR